jgi:hypothetical protein
MSQGEVTEDFSTIAIARWLAIRRNLNIGIKKGISKNAPRSKDLMVNDTEVKSLLLSICCFNSLILILFVFHVVLLQFPVQRGFADSQHARRG